MKIKERFIYVIDSILYNKSRNILSMFGIVIGISLVIVVFSLGATVGNVVDQMLAEQGVDLPSVDVFWIDVANPDEPIKSMSKNAIEEFKKKYSNIVYDFLFEAPDKISGYLVKDKNTYLKTKKYSHAELSGVSKGYEKYKNLNLVSGRFVNELDCSLKKNVVVISDTSAIAMFEKTSCLGETIKLISNDGKNIDFTIIGVYHYIDKTLKSENEYNTLKTTAYIPYSVMNGIFGKDTEENTWSRFSKILPISSEYCSLIQANATSFFTNFLQDIYGETVEVTAFANENGEAEGITELPKVITGIFLAIAMISLVVGGVGVMNINLINVTERTPEIGICKALGAKKRTIAGIFLLESVIVCVVAGAIGIVVGYGLDVLIQILIPKIINTMPITMAETKNFLLSVDLSVKPTLTSIVASFFITVLTGVIFGFIPASKASKMVVVDALRFE